MQPTREDRFSFGLWTVGERTPDRPDATGALHGVTLDTSTPAHPARASVEGLLCGLADALDALVDAGVPVRRVLLVGGGARSDAVARIAPAVFGRPVLRPTPGEYVADGAARQAAWVVAGSAAPPVWEAADTESFDAEPTPAVRARYAQARDLTVPRVGVRVRASRGPVVRESGSRRARVGVS